MPAPLGDPRPRAGTPARRPPRPRAETRSPERGPAHRPWKTTGPRMQRGRETRAGRRRRGVCRELQFREARAGESQFRSLCDSRLTYLRGQPSAAGAAQEGSQFSRGHRVAAAASRLGLGGLRRAVVPERAALPPPVPVRGARFPAEAVPQQRVRALGSGPHPAPPADPEPAGGNPGCEPSPPRTPRPPEPAIRAPPRARSPVARTTAQACGGGSRGSRSASPAPSARGPRRSRRRCPSRGPRRVPEGAGAQPARRSLRAWTRSCPNGPGARPPGPAHRRAARPAQSRGSPLASTRRLERGGRGRRAAPRLGAPGSEPELRCLAQPATRDGSQRPY